MAEEVSVADAAGQPGDLLGRLVGGGLLVGELDVQGGVAVRLAGGDVTSREVPLVFHVLGQPDHVRVEQGHLLGPLVGQRAGGARADAQATEDHGGQGRDHNEGQDPPADPPVAQGQPGARARCSGARSLVHVTRGRRTGRGSGRGQRGRASVSVPHGPSAAGHVGPVGHGSLAAVALAGHRSPTHSLRTSHEQGFRGQPSGLRGRSRTTSQPSFPSSFPEQTFTAVRSPRCSPQGRRLPDDQGNSDV